MSSRRLLVVTLGLAVMWPTTALAQQSPEPQVPPADASTAQPAQQATERPVDPVEQPVAPVDPTVAPVDPAVDQPSGSPEPVVEDPELEVVEPTLPELDFMVGDWELQKLPWRELRLNGRRLVPLKFDGPQDANGVPLATLRDGGRRVYNPTVLAQQGMKRLDAYRRTGNRVYLRQARKYADFLARQSIGGKQRRWQPHDYRLGVHKRGWVNSNSHGLVLSFLSRYYHLTGAKRRLAEATRLFKAFERRPEHKRWFSNVTNAGYIWFEHWPDGTKDHTLNAHINAIFGLYDYWLATEDPLAEAYILGGIKTVHDKLYRFRRKGELSRYSLASTVGTLHYHETHIEQLRVLARMTGDEWFDRRADRFERDEVAWKIKYRGRPPSRQS